MNASFIWLAAATGALSLLTPCVFPMIPVTIAYFNQRSAQDESRALTHALLFAAGIIVTFTALGLGLAVLVGAAGLARFAAEPWVNITIGVFFLAFALSLLGAYDLPLPFSNRFLNRVDASARKRSGKAVGSVLMGFAFTLASFTCTAPFVGPLLVSAARGDWQQPLLGMAVFSTVFATPFFLLALMPHWTASLPRAGGWLKDVKVVVGLFEIAAALTKRCPLPAIERPLVSRFAPERTESKNSSSLIIPVLEPGWCRDPTASAASRARPAGSDDA